MNTYNQHIYCCQNASIYHHFIAIFGYKIKEPKDVLLREFNHNENKLLQNKFPL